VAKVVGVLLMVAALSAEVYFPQTRNLHIIAGSCLVIGWLILRIAWRKGI
jgi:hypothetical protein